MWPFRKKDRSQLQKKVRPQPGIVIHIHEDDWEMRSLYPLAAWDQVADDIDAAVEHADKHVDPETGFSDEIRMIQPPEEDYSSTGLIVDDLKAVLGAHLPFVSRFYATAGFAMETGERDPFGAYEEDAVCFGFDRHCFVKVERFRDVVKRIWFEADTVDPDKLAALKAALLEVEKCVPSVIADYWSYSYGRIGDEQFLTAYFERLSEDD